MGSLKMTRLHRQVLAVVTGLGLLALAVATGLGLLASAGPTLAQQGPQGPPPARVSTAEVTRQLLSPEILVPGTVISKNDSRISITPHSGD